MAIGTTKLQAVNRLLRMISQAPVTALGTIGVDSSAEDALDYAHLEVCGQQWPFCIQETTLQPDESGEIRVGNDVLGVLLLNECDRHRWIVKGGKLFDSKQSMGFQVDGEKHAQLTVLVPWEDMQEHQKQYVIATASRTWVRDKLQDPAMIASINQEYGLTKQRFLSVEMGNAPVNLLDGDFSGWQRPLAGNAYTGRSWPYW